MKTLEEARKVIDERGWGQGPVLRRKQGGTMCLLQALAHVALSVDEWMSAAERLRDNIEKRVGKRVGLIEFNDAKTTTLEDIHAVLE